MLKYTFPIPIAVVLSCSGAESKPSPAPTARTAAFDTQAIVSLDEPWAMTFLPDGRLLVSQKQGSLLVVGQDGSKLTVSGVPSVDYGGQGGFGDVVLHPDFKDNALVYLSYVESGRGGRGAVVVRAKLMLGDEGGRLDAIERIWEQSPKVSGRGHYGHRIAFSPDGYLFISSGERQKFDPAQDMNANLGKVLRLNGDGSVPGDNPFFEQGGVTAQIWSLGHRNPLGLAFDAEGRLWNTEMGPRGGDELNLVERGKNYGYPIVSNGRHYSGANIPDHATRPDLEAPKEWWSPVISPAGLIVYRGERFVGWRGNIISGGLSSMSLIRIEVNEGSAQEVQRFAMGARIREVEEGPDGALWVLEDGPGGRLLKLIPR
ncbi:MAG: PQQ-dependent sugar dehydrogenase [Myxococcota bacterium]